MKTRSVQVRRQLRRSMGEYPQRIALNCNPGQLRDATTGRCGPGIGINIPREQMPQIPSDSLGAFKDFCREQDVTLTDGWQPASELKPTQSGFRQERVDTISDATALMTPTIVSKDDFILDGTHRWVKHWQRNPDAMVPTLTVGLELHAALELMRAFPGAKFVGNSEDQPRDGHGRWSSGNGKVVGHVETAHGKIPVTYDNEVMSPEEAERFTKWLSKIPKTEMAKSAAKRIEVFSDSDAMRSRMDEVGINPEIGESGEVRGAFDFSTGTLYASSWNGYEHSPHNLLHEFGHSVTGYEEGPAEAWASAHSQLVKNERTVPVVLQHDGVSCGAACLAAIARYFGIDATKSQMAKDIGTSVDGTSVAQMVQGAFDLGLHAKVMTNPTQAPFIASTTTEKGVEHWVVVTSLGILINTNPEGCNQFTGPECSLGNKREHFYQIAKSVLGSYKVEDQGYKITAKIGGNRIVSLRFKDLRDRQVVMIDFDYARRKSMTPDKELRPGSLDLAHKLKNLVSSYHAAGYYIEAHGSDARRDRVYSKILSSMGLKEGKEGVWNLSQQTNSTEQVVAFMDPSVGNRTLPAEEFHAMWHNRQTRGLAIVVTAPTGNSNPEGCNQHTGPDCGGTGSETFKKWFGNSKVVDEHGEPLKVYHGTNRDFDSFDAGKFGATDTGFAGAGHYFIDHPDWADAYAEQSVAAHGGTAKTLSVHLKIENPLEITSFSDIPEMKEASNNWMKKVSREQEIERAKAIQKRLISEGYDGVILRGTGGNPSEYVAFHGNQIKSTSNKGDYSADSNIHNLATNRFKLRTSDEWQAATGKRKLPKNLPAHNSFRKRKRIAANAMRLGLDVQPISIVPQTSNSANSANLLKRDPTRTLTLRRAMANHLKRQFAKLKAKLVALVVGENAFGLTENRFEFKTSPDKLKAFQQWLRQQFNADIDGLSEEEVWKKYIHSGFVKGAGRAFDDTKRPYAKGHGTDKGVSDFYKGTRHEFLQSSFAQPETREKVELLASRAFDELKDVTAEMGNRMSRVLGDALIEGKNPRAVARELSDQADISYKRAKVISRTELSRAHSQGQLNAFKQLGVEELGVDVELHTGPDPCEECAANQGVVYSIEESNGVIPVHPNCVCCFVPNFDRMTKNQLRGTAKVWRGYAWNLGLVDNAFCPTGPGGGVNPYCSPGGRHASPSDGLNTGKSLADYLRVNLKAKMTDAMLDKIAHVHPNGIQGGTFHVPASYVHVPSYGKQGVQDKVDDLFQLLPAGTVIKSKDYSKIKLPSATPATSSVPAVQPTPNPVSTLQVVPFSKEHTWETGKPAPGILNGVPFDKTPPKFWEHTKDVDIKEPKEIGKIARVGIMIQEPDGRMWICQPTNGFGDRNHTLPGGTVEHGLTHQQNALKETWEETGLHVEITGHLGDFADSNHGKPGSYNERIGRLYVGRRIGGAPWDAKIEDGSHGVTIKYQAGKGSHDPSKNGEFAAESSHVKLVTKERAAELLHRTDDLAQLATVHPIALNTKTDGNMMMKLVNGIQPKAKEWLQEQHQAGSSRPGNQELHVVQELRGFNKPPTVVSKKEMDDLVKGGGHVEMMRAVSGIDNKTDDQLVEQFKSGTHYPGHGIFGSGTYADASSTGYKGYSNVATSGQYGNKVIRMVLPKTAKIIKMSELEKAVPNSPGGFKAYLNKGGKRSRECWMGVQAALAGYDAIHADKDKKSHQGYGDNFYIILNRGALIVQKEDAKGHEIK